MCYFFKCQKTASVFTHVFQKLETYYLDDSKIESENGN